jgi:tetratricopeptide (TPR) repeat protein
MAVAAIFALCSAIFAAPALAQPLRDFQTPRDCFLPLGSTNALSLNPARDSARMQAIAQGCAAAAEQRPRPGLVFAYFYAGWANGALGAGALAPPANESILSIDTPPTEPGARRLREAARLLEISARMASADGADSATLRAGQRARLELARAYRLLGLIDADRFADAQRELSALERNGAGDLGNSVAYERAMFILDRLRPGAEEDAQLHSALQDLSAFANVDPDPLRDQYVVDRGPAQLARLAFYMGNLALNRQPQTVENTQLALRHFRDAVSAYAALSQTGAGVDRAAAARIRVRMGLLNLRMASLLGQGQLAEFGCAPGADAYSISEAEGNFSAARGLDPQSADAHWGLGCALMARNNANAAIASFQQAVALYNAPGTRALSRGDYYLGLARALALAGQWDGPSGAVANFNTALAGERDAARVAAIRLEIARIYAQNQRWSQARASLEESVRAHADPQAYLMLGKLLYDHSDLDPGSNLVSAREALTRAVAIAGPHQPEANYYLSLVEERAGNGPRAVSYATAAAQGERGNTDYRRQACLTRIVFSRTRDQGQAYCSADPSDREAYPRALFYEGMFWLRQAYDSSGGNQRNDWALAIRSFEAGANELGGRSQLVDDQSLGRLLGYGRFFAFYCAGLGTAIQSESGSPEWASERGLFKDRYRLGECWRR